MQLYRKYYESPIGDIQVLATDKGVRSVQFIDRREEQESQETAEVLQECLEQLDQYFAGELQHFSNLKLSMHATDFQQDIWDASLEIPFGTTVSYEELAQKSGHKKAARAVGNALNKNAFLLLVPCHRIVPSDGSIGGFAAGSWRKDWLLRHEGVL